MVGVVTVIDRQEGAGEAFDRAKARTIFADQRGGLIRKHALVRASLDELAEEGGWFGCGGGRLRGSGPRRLIGGENMSAEDLENFEADRELRLAQEYFTRRYLRALAVPLR